MIKRFSRQTNIGNVLSERDLAAEFQALKGAAAQLPPEKYFGLGWEAPKLPCALPVASQSGPPHP
jgi:hypothetical protein